jgi:TRAP-type C4-dicarboxylate transport system permease small subunit
VKASGVRRVLDRLLEAVLAFLMAGMVLNVLWQICTRFLLGDPSSFTEELARFALIWLGMLGASYGFGKRLHLAVDLLGGWLGNHRVRIRRLGFALELVTHFCIAVFAVSILVVGGSRLVALTLHLGQASAALAIPLGAVYAVLPISGCIVLIYTGLALLEVFAERRGGRWQGIVEEER